VADPNSAEGTADGLEHAAIDAASTAAPADLRIVWSCTQEAFGRASAET
jgi:hypothetical protein